MTDDLDALAAQVLDQYPGPEHASLQALIVALLDLVDSLANRVAELEAEAGRHSANSSKPPSGDTLAQRQAQKARRQQWTNKDKPKRGKGKQPGAPGAHLAQVEVPDVVVAHPAPFCEGCGASLAGAEVISTETRQVFDIPTPKIEVTAHVVETRRCSCGCESTGEFPPEATAPAAYGPVVSGVGTYLLAHQHLPVARTAEALADLVGMEVSTGWVSGLLPKAKGLLDHFLIALRYRLMASPVMANDETGAKIDTQRFWFHAATTESLTLISCHRRRGRIGMEAAGVLPGFDGVSVHDRYAQYWLFGCQHSACHAHLLRDLAAVAERASQKPWAEAMAKLLLDARDATEKGSERWEGIVVQAPVEGHRRGLRRHRHPGDPGQSRPLAAGPRRAHAGRAGILEPGTGLQGAEGGDPPVLQEPGSVVHLQHRRAGIPHDQDPPEDLGGGFAAWRVPRHSAPHGATSRPPASTA